MERAKSAFAFVRCSNRSERGGETRETFRTGREVRSESFLEGRHGRFEARCFHSSRPSRLSHLQLSGTICTQENKNGLAGLWRHQSLLHFERKSRRSDCPTSGQPGKAFRALLRMLLCEQGRRFDCEVEMISHNTKRVNLPPEPIAGLTETIFERCGRPFAHEQVPAAVAPVNDVITPARKFESHRSLHQCERFAMNTPCNYVAYPIRGRCCGPLSRFTIWPRPDSHRLFPAT